MREMEVINSSGSGKEDSANDHAEEGATPAITAAAADMNGNGADGATREQQAS